MAPMSSAAGPRWSVHTTPLDGLHDVAAIIRVSVGLRFAARL